MESSTSKTSINILLILAIVLIIASIATSYNNSKKQPIVTQQVHVSAPAPRAPSPATTTPQSDNNQNSLPTNATTTATSSIQQSTTTSQRPTVSTTTLGTKKWTWVSTTSQGKTLTPREQTIFSVTFSANGQLSGTTDCNTFNGTYKYSSTTIAFGPIASTKMFCEKSQENDFMKVFQGSKKYSIDANTILTITDSTTTILLK